MKFNNIIDHTILTPDATKADVIKICNEAKEYKFASVCVNSYYARLVSNELKDSDVKTCVVVGFPLGAMSTEAKSFEAKKAVKDGAEEIDMVINIGALKDKDYDVVFNDIKAVVEVSENAIVKVIIETCLLTDEEKVKACKIAVEAGCDFVKTSTGFSTGGAKKEDIALMRKTVGPNIGVKASGGIRTYEDAKEMYDAGASRIGSSAGIKIVSENK